MEELVEYPEETMDNTSTTSERRRVIEGLYDPYAPIRKKEGITESGNRVGYGIEIEVKDEIGLPRWEIVGSVKENYLLIPNSDMRDLAMDIVDKSPWEFKQDTLMFNGTSYVLTLDVMDEEAMSEVSAGDMLGFGLMFRNSYNGSTSASVGLYMKQLVCGNGMISTTFFRQHKFRHSVNNANWEEDAREALSIVNSAPGKVRDFAERMSELKNTKVDQAFLKRLRKGPAKVLPQGTWGAIMTRWAEKEEDNAYGVLNASTNVLWHHRNIKHNHLRQNDLVVTGMLGDREWLTS
jgi:hypothetical protein